MFFKRIPLFRLFGFQVGIDLSFLLLAFFLVWSLAAGIFPMYFEGLSRGAYWWMGVAGMLGLFASIIFHEFCHSLVARRFGMEMRGITLFVFGGIAEMPDEPDRPLSEFLMAAAGPLSSIALAGALLGFGQIGVWRAWPVPIWGVLMYLMWLNAALAVFNLIPAFPLDGGRILRSGLWAVKGDLRWATRVASHFGSAFGIMLIVLGVLVFITGNVIGGVWYFLIGLFIRSAARMSYSRVVVRDVLKGERIERFMNPRPVTVEAGLHVADAVEDFFYRHHHKMFPVVSDGDLLGCITAEQIHRVPRDQWADTEVGTVTEQCTGDNTVNARADAMDVLTRMRSAGRTRLMVLDAGRLVGVLTLRDLLSFLALKIDLESDGRPEVALNV
ncbi:MAG: site-2 protease family protein [Phycisphaerae bacterium]|nr:site-2 protease family protein [Phycisphaerae bacterium]